MPTQRFKNVVRTPTGSTELVGQTVESVPTKANVLDDILAGPNGAKVSVVVVVNDHPDLMMRCLHSIKKSTKTWPDDLMEVIVVNNGSDFFTSKLLKNKPDLWDKLLTVDEYQGWLPAVAAGFEQADEECEIVILIDSAVEVFDGCFERVIEAFSENSKRLGMATVWSSKQVPAFRGMSLKETAARFTASHRFKQLGVDESEQRGVDVGLPSPAFIAFDRRVFDKIGGWQVDNFGPGTGAIEDMAMRTREIGYRVALVPSVLVRDESGWPVAMPVGKDGSLRLAKQWDEKKLWDAAGWYSPVKSVSLAAGVSMNKKPTVVWVFRETVICGATLLAAHVSNQLIQRGWESTMSCTRFDPGHQNVMPMDFGPMSYSNDDAMVKGLINGLPEGAVVIAPLWVTTKLVKEICDARPDLHPVYYVQDDEARFQTPAGEFYVKRDVVEDSYKLLPNVLANSLWVADLVAKITGKDVPVICPGVDALMFRPGPSSWGDRVTVMAHCRPKTPRRGWAFIEAVMRRVAMSREVRFVTYDETVDCRVPHHVQLGRLSPSNLSREMSRADIFIEGSEVQGFGMQALEAMASGLALVCTDNLGIDTFGTSMHDCVIIPHGDVERAAAVICRLVDERLEREQLGDNGRAVACDFSWDNIGGLWDEYLKEVSNAS
jgi:glycosyltransferase involved in cell wall biosynthesis